MQSILPMPGEQSFSEEDLGLKQKETKRSIEQQQKFESLIAQTKQTHEGEFLAPEDFTLPNGEEVFEQLFAEPNADPAGAMVGARWIVEGPNSRRQYRYETRVEENLDGELIASTTILTVGQTPTISTNTPMNSSSLQMSLHLDEASVQALTNEIGKPVLHPVYDVPLERTQRTNWLVRHGYQPNPGYPTTYEKTYAPQSKQETTTTEK